MNWYLAVLKKYAEFKGRARRKEYWMFFLFNVIASIIFAVVDAALGSGETIGNLYSLAVFIPSIAVAVRRMHDVGKSGWFILIPIYNLILACTDSVPGENEYGTNPKDVSSLADNDVLDA